VTRRNIFFIIWRVKRTQKKIDISRFASTLQSASTIQHAQPPLSPTLNCPFSEHSVST